MAFGLNPDVFWRQTPRTIDAAFKGREKAMTAEHRMRAWHAWTNAALQRAKRMPRFESILPPKPANDLSIVITRMKQVGKNLPAPKKRKLNGL